MRVSRRAVAVGGVVVATIGLVIALSGFRGAAPPPAPSQGVTPTQTRIVGAASCSGRSCHGGIEPLSGGRIGGNEYTVWCRSDPHASAYHQLFGERARRIMALWGPTDNPAGFPAHQHSRCLACHAQPETAAAPRLAAMRVDGVSCEACHGLAQDWLDAHTNTQLPQPEKTRLGMTLLSDPFVIARACAGCHVGAPPEGEVPLRDVNHDLIAAGHPRLTFEFTSYLANLTPHWRGSSRPVAGEAVGVWMAGQMMSARAAAELLAYRAGAHPPGSGTSPVWPEFAEYDCSSCHHSLGHSRPVLARRPGDHSLGLPRWGSWYYAMLGVIPKQENQALVQLDDLQRHLERRNPDRDHIGESARTFARLIGTGYRPPTDPPGRLHEWRELLKGVERGRRAISTAGWDGAEQLTIAMAVLALTRDRDGPRSRLPARHDQKTLALIDPLMSRLCPPRLGSPSAFAWDAEFDTQFEQLLQHLRAK